MSLTPGEKIALGFEGFTEAEIGLVDAAIPVAQTIVIEVKQLIPQVEKLLADLKAVIPAAEAIGKHLEN